MLLKIKNNIQILLGKALSLWGYRIFFKNLKHKWQGGQKKAKLKLHINVRCLIYMIDLTGPL